MTNRESLLEGRNLRFQPITDPLYADSLALHAHMNSYDYIVSQPVVLGPEASARFREIAAKPGTQLPEPPLPLEALDG